jgi:hypothetical protein
MGSASPQIFDGHSFTYAGLWRRLQAYILDFLVLWPLTMALDALLRLSTGLPFDTDVIFEFTSQNVQVKYDVMEEVWIGTALLYSQPLRVPVGRRRRGNTGSDWLSSTRTVTGSRSCTPLGARSASASPSHRSALASS